MNFYGVYRAYMNSRSWKELSALARSRDNDRCVFCGKQATSVHHVKYPKHFCDDDLANIISVCSNCHRLSHGIREDAENHFFYADRYAEWCGKNQEIIREAASMGNEYPEFAIESRKFRRNLKRLGAHRKEYIEYLSGAHSINGMRKLQEDIQKSIDAIEADHK